MTTTTAPPRGPRLQDVATACGVSRSTASRVRAELAAQIRATAARLGYVRLRRRTPRPPDPVGYVVARPSTAYATVVEARLAANRRNAAARTDGGDVWVVYALVPVHTGHRELGKGPDHQSPRSRADGAA
jgi:hypothetical protein